MAASVGRVTGNACEALHGIRAGGEVGEFEAENGHGGVGNLGRRGGGAILDDEGKQSEFEIRDARMGPNACARGLSLKLELVSPLLPSSGPGNLNER